MCRFPFAIFSLREANSNSNQFIFLKFDPPCSRNRPRDPPWNHWNPYQLLEDHPRADGYVVSNYGDRKSPSWGCGTPSKWPWTWLVFAGWSQPRTSPGMMIKPFVRIPVTARKGITNSQLSGWEVFRFHHFSKQINWWWRSLRLLDVHGS